MGGEGFLGKTDREFHPLVMAEQYIEEDRQVIETDEAAINQIHYVMSHGKRPGWFNCSKLPLHGHDGSVVGLAMIRFPVRCPTEKNTQLRKLAPAIRALEERHNQQLSMEELAGLAGMSSTHFNRQFSSLLGTSPTRLLHAMRIDRARHLLATTDQTIADIAVEIGYYDQPFYPPLPPPLWHDPACVSGAVRGERGGLTAGAKLLLVLFHRSPCATAQSRAR